MALRQSISQRPELQSDTEAERFKPIAGHAQCRRNSGAERLRLRGLHELLYDV